MYLLQVAGYITIVYTFLSTGYMRYLSCLKAITDTRSQTIQTAYKQNRFSDLKLPRNILCNTIYLCAPFPAKFTTHYVTHKKQIKFLKTVMVYMYYHKLIRVHTYGIVVSPVYACNVHVTFRDNQEAHFHLRLYSPILCDDIVPNCRRWKQGVDIFILLKSWAWYGTVYCWELYVNH